MDQVALGSFPAGPEVRGPALEEALPAGRDQDDLRRCLGEFRPPDVAKHKFGQRRLVQRTAENDQDATAEIRGARRHDRVKRRLANGEDDDRRRGEGADRHAEPWTAEVEAADDRQGDAGDDWRQLPGRQVLRPRRGLLGSIARHRLHLTGFSLSQGSAEVGL